MKLIDYLRNKSLHDSTIDFVNFDGKCLNFILSTFDRDTDQEVHINIIFSDLKDHPFSKIKEWVEKNDNIGVLSLTCEKTDGGYKSLIMAESFDYVTKAKDFLKISIFSGSATVSLEHN